MACRAPAEPCAQRGAEVSGPDAQQAIRRPHVSGHLTDLRIASGDRKFYSATGQGGLAVVRSPSSPHSSTLLDNNLTFLFYHYGSIPRYLRHAIEHLRIFNPDSEILLITESGVQDAAVAHFDVRQLGMAEFASPKLSQLRETYRHTSCFKEKFERFVLERWFVTELIRAERPERTYVMQDSDVAVFGDVAPLVPLLPDCPICLASMNPHFTFIRSSIDHFLDYMLDFYADERRITESLARHHANRNSSQIFNQGEMQFLHDYLKESKLMQFYQTDTRYGFVDCNIHIPQDFDYLQLKRRPRKKVLWAVEDGRLVPHFLRQGRPVRALIIHFQGPGKRVFFRFNRLGKSSGYLGVRLINILFQKRLIASFT